MTRTDEFVAALVLGLAACAPSARAVAQDNVVTRREIQSLYDRASAASVAARTAADLESIHQWLDTPDCVYKDFGQPVRTWTEMRANAVRGLETRLTSFNAEIVAIDVRDDLATTTAVIRAVATVVDGQGSFGRRGATHDVETTATVRDAWVRSTIGWRRRSHEKIVGNHVTAVDGKPLK